MTPKDFKEQIFAGSNVALAKAITLAESSRDEHRTSAEEILGLILPKTGKSIRLGISGPPGVGKSTFIEAFGLNLIERDHKVAVLAIDPSSPVNGGSILGDKTRMNKLANHSKAFIRPSPSGGNLGGVARRTREAILLCEAAGYDVIMIETVGVGQSDHAVAGMTDFFLQLHQPLSGDDLQGIKKGSNEFTNLIIITKGDGTLKDAAQIAKSQIDHSFHLSSEFRTPPKALIVSAKTGLGISEVCAEIEGLKQSSLANGSLTAKRLTQFENWFEEEVKIHLESLLPKNVFYRKIYEQNLKQVQTDQSIAPRAARDLVLSLIGGFPST